MECIKMNELIEAVHIKAKRFNVSIHVDMNIQCYKKDEPEITYRIYRGDYGSRNFKSIDKAMIYIINLEAPEDD